MKRINLFRLLLVVAIVPAIAAIAAAEDTKEEAIRKDRQQTKGTWRITQLVVNGKTVKEEDARKLTVVNGGDGTWSLRSAEQEISAGTSTIDPAQKPKAIDFTVTEGGGIGNEHRGIYELGENTRRLCFAPVGKDRPSEFSSPPDSQLILATFERIKSP